MTGVRRRDQDRAKDVDLRHLGQLADLSCQGGNRPGPHASARRRGVASHDLRPTVLDKRKPALEELRRSGLR